MLALAGTICAQEQEPVERSTNKVILEGKVYYIHVVKPGQTLYAISKAYHISQKELAIENPGVMSGLQLGQALKIPVNPTMEEEIDTSGLEATGGQERIHIVKAGETLFSISRMYGTDEESLLLANPGLDAASLHPGQRILIPAKSTVDQEGAFNEEGFVYHKVKRRETLYSIARFYDVSVQEIRNANPELGWGGPKTGQVIRIPRPQVLDHPETLLDTITPMDTIPWVVTDTLILPYDYEEPGLRHYEPDRVYRVAYFIPFDFKASEPLDSLLKDVTSVARKNRITERYRMEEQIPQSVNFLEFFQGSLMAIDSLRKTGMKLDVHFFDTQKSLDRTRALLLEEPLEDFDLFIGPFYIFNLEVVAQFARDHRIPLVTPFYNELNLVTDNPYLFQLSPSMEEEYRQAARIIASKYMYNIVYVREQDSLDVEKNATFKELIFDGFDRYHPQEPVIFKEVVQELNHTDEIVHSLSPDMKNLVIVPTRNEALASRVMSSLYYQSGNYDIEVMGTTYWTEFASIDYRYYHQLNLIFYSSFWVDYMNEMTERFLSLYRQYYYNEPRETSRKGMNFGIIGYDMSFYFLNALRAYGSRFILSMEEYHPGLVQGPLGFERVGPAGGYENRSINFYQFAPDMEIHRIEVPEYPSDEYFFRPMEDPHRRRYLNLDRELELK